MTNITQNKPLLEVMFVFLSQDLFARLLHLILALKEKVKPASLVVMLTFPYSRKLLSLTWQFTFC